MIADFAFESIDYRTRVVQMFQFPYDTDRAVGELLGSFAFPWSALWGESDGKRNSKYILWAALASPFGPW